LRKMRFQDYSLINSYTKLHLILSLMQLAVKKLPLIGYPDRK
jgi:hypothetical protein